MNTNFRYLLSKFFDNLKVGRLHTVTLPRTVIPYRDSVKETRDRVMDQKLVTR